MWVLSDEIYGQIVFDQPHQSALPHDADGRAIIVSGMSKSYAMTGYRVGFTRANPEYIEIASKLQEPFVSCGTGFSQLASADALKRPARRRSRHVAAPMHTAATSPSMFCENTAYTATPPAARST